MCTCDSTAWQHGNCSGSGKHCSVCRQHVLLILMRLYYAEDVFRVTHRAIFFEKPHETGLRSDETDLHSSNREGLAENVERPPLLLVQKRCGSRNEGGWTSHSLRVAPVSLFRHCFDYPVVSLWRHVYHFQEGDTFSCWPSLAIPRHRRVFRVAHSPSRRLAREGVP